MPSIVIKVTWDIPDRQDWLNPHHLELILSEYCRNTAFEITELTKEGEIFIEDAPSGQRRLYWVDAQND